MLHRQPLSLPYADQVPAVARFVRAQPYRGPREPSDPARLVDAALHHRVGGYLLAALKGGQLGLPARDRQRLQGDAAGSALMTAVLRHQLADVAGSLAAACGCQPLLVKGPAVAEMFYPDRRLRPYYDLDLLVPHEQLTSAAEALAASGYRTLEEFRPGYAERYGHDIHMEREVAGHRVAVELHWRVGDDPVTSGLSHARLARDAETVAIGSAHVTVPSPSAHLLVLGVHLLSDREKRLSWVNDVALAARSLDADGWAQAFALAEELGLAWPLHRALDYAELHLGFDRARPGVAGPPPAWGPLRAVEELNVRASPHFGRLAVLGWRDRMRFLRAVLAPSRAGLDGTVGADGAGTLRLVGRHARKAVAGLAPRRDSRRRRLERR